MQIIQNDEHYKFVVEEGILRAEKSIWIATANLKDMQIAMCGGRFKSIASFLNEQAEAGICVRLLYGGEPSMYFKKSFEKLKKHKNFLLKRCQRNHFKTVIIDGKYMYLGSANLTGAGIGFKKSNRRNFEMGIITSDFNEIDKVQSLFNLIWEDGFCEECGRKKYC